MVYLAAAPPRCQREAGRSASVEQRWRRGFSTTVAWHVRWLLKQPRAVGSEVSEVFL